MTQYITKEKASVVRERKQTVIDRELDRIYEKHKNVTTDLVIAEAKDKANPLHAYFEWDDKVAGEKFRQTQALQMLMASKFVVVLETSRSNPPRVVSANQPEVRRFVSSFRGEGFKMRNEVLSDKDERAVLIARFRARLRGWCDAVVDIEELAPLRALIAEHLGDAEEPKA